MSNVYNKYVYEIQQKFIFKFNMDRGFMKMNDENINKIKFNYYHIQKQVAGYLYVLSKLDYKYGMYLVKLQLMFILFQNVTHCGFTLFCSR